MSRVGGSGAISYVPANADCVEASTEGFGVNAQDVAGGGNEANESDFGAAGSNALEHEPVSSSVELASAIASRAGNETRVVFRVQVSSTQAAGSYSGTVNYTALPNF